MMQKTNIEYLDYSWSPIAMRCTPISEGCANCWHLGMADRMANNPVFSDEVRRAYAGKEPPVLVESRLDDPFKRKTPSRIGVQFMGDLWHEDVSNQLINWVFDKMRVYDWHTYLVLTKRPERISDWWFRYRNTVSVGTPRGIRREPRGRQLEWPKQVWLGVTVENQKTANERIPALLDIDAWVHWVSMEPLLEQIVLDPLWLQQSHSYDNSKLNAINWCVVGGESSIGARPMHPQWAYDLLKQCQEHSIPYFFKQQGAWRPTTFLEAIEACTTAVSGYPTYDSFSDGYLALGGDFEPGDEFTCVDAWKKPELEGSALMKFKRDDRGLRIEPGPGPKALGRIIMKHVGKKEAGHLLGGKEYKEMPKL